MLRIDDMLSHKMVRNHCSESTMEHFHVVEMCSIRYARTRGYHNMRCARVHIADGLMFRQ